MIEQWTEDLGGRRGEEMGGARFLYGRGAKRFTPQFFSEKRQ